MRSVLPLPVTAPEITPEWLTAALSESIPDVVVQECRVVDVIEGTSTKIRVRLTCNQAGVDAGLPETLIVKGGFQEHSPRMSYMYAAEMRYYRELAPRMSLKVPRCWFAGSDPGSHQSIVILEDLVLRGVRFCDARRPHGYQQTAAFLDALARTHAQWWAKPALEDDGELGWMMQPFDALSWSYYRHYLEPERWRHCLQLPRAAAVSQRFHDPAWIEAALASLGRFHASGVKTLTHGDTHLGNLYTEADGSPGFLDAQARRSPWYHDVPYHLIGSLDIADRRRWETSLLTWYLQRLVHYGVSNPPDFDEAFEAYRRSIVYGLMIFLINETLFQSEAINTAYTARFGAAAADHRIWDFV